MSSPPKALVPPPELPLSENDAKANGLRQLRVELELALDRNHVEVDQARKALETAHQTLRAAEAARRELEARLIVATGQVDADGR